MKNKSLVTLFLSIFLSISMAFAQNSQNRMVYWIHGLNEDASFWESMCEELTPDNGICLEYDSDHAGGINGIAATLNAQIPSNEYVILVGHSAGGLIARTIQQQNSKVIGVITVGTPNYGAPIINSMQTASYKNIVDRLVDNIKDVIYKTRDAVLDIYGDLYILWFFCNYGDNLLELATELTSAGHFVDLVETFALDYFDNWTSALLDQPMVLDMHPESTSIQAMIQDSTNRRNISSIHGAEDNGQLYRLIFSAMSESDTGTPNDTIIDTYQDKLDELQAQTLYVLGWVNRTKNVTSWLRFVIPIPVFTMNSILDHASSVFSSLSSLLRYINVDIHTDWAEEIGAYHYEERVIRVPIYDNGGITIGGGGGVDGPITDIPGEQIGDLGEIIGYEEEIRTVLVNESHDGLIPSSSALIRTTGTTYHEHTVSGANHLEMENHAGVKDCIEMEIDRYLATQVIIGPVIPYL